MKFLLSFLFFLTFQNLLGDEIVHRLDFFMLDDVQKVKLLDGKKIKIRGFLYFNQDQWILSSDPFLKTCCVGSKVKTKQQVFLNGSFDKRWIKKIVEIEGIFKLGDNNPASFLILSPILVEKNYHLENVLAMLGVVLIIVGIKKWITKKGLYKQTLSPVKTSAD